MKNSACLFLLLALGGAAAAAPAPGPKKSCELALDADKVEANVVGGKGGVASGNVVITQCDMKLRADTVRVMMANKQYDRIVANGKVLLISAKSGVVSGDTGVYDVARQLVTVTGHVVLKDGANVFSGTQLTYNVATGDAHFDAAATAAGAPGTPAAGNGRVHAILSPPAESTGK
jgi:lipopolysaccharide export system protein LptA